MKLVKNSHIRYSLYFFIIAIIFSWPFFFIADAWLVPSLIKDGKSGSAMFVSLGGHICGMFGPALAGFIGYKFMLHQKLIRWKWNNYKLYLKGGLFLTGVWLIPAIIGFFPFKYKLASSITDLHTMFIYIYLMMGWFAGMGEEYGWCGFLLPFLSLALGRTTAITVSGIYRGLWHFPILIGPFLYKVFTGEGSLLLVLPISVVFIFQLVISNVLFGAYFANYWYKTESIPLLGWFHFVFDFVRDFSMFFIIGYENSLLGKIGWAMIFYYFAYLMFYKIAREDGIKHIFKFIFNKNFSEIDRPIK